jgi:electron transport complex protein RnfB
VARDHLPADPRLHPRARLILQHRTPPPDAGPSLPADAESAIAAVDRILPQTQCTQCGHGGCRPYARAIVMERAPINRCPPGGAAGIAALAALTGRPATALDPECGVEAPRRIARIVASLCIGCTKCIQACPVDAIAGAPKRLHAVIPELCTGCDLCLAPCPVDCIERVEPPPALAGWRAQDADAARARHEARARRLERRRREGDTRHPLEAQAQLEALASETEDPAAARKRAVIEAAIARARARLEALR